MKIFLDTANLQEIKSAYEYGIIEGITTNPTLIAQQTNQDFHEVIKSIAQLVPGPISAEVTGFKAEEMIKEGRELAKINDNIVIKVPINKEGIKATAQLTKESIAVNVTLVFSPNQALLAAKANATYVSPFLGRLDDIGEDGIGLVEDIAQLFALHDIQTKIIAASIRHPQHVFLSALAGADICTVPYNVLEKMFNHPLTDKGIAQFSADWQKRKQ